MDVMYLACILIPLAILAGMLHWYRLRGPPDA